MVPDETFVGFSKVLRPRPLDHFTGHRFTEVLPRTTAVSTHRVKSASRARPQRKISTERARDKARVRRDDEIVFVQETKINRYGRVFFFVSTDDRKIISSVIRVVIVRPTDGCPGVV